MHAKDLYERLAAGYDYDPMYGELCNERDGLKKENAKLREQGARLFDKTLELGTENEKLRELVRKWYPHMLKRVGRDALKQWGQMDVVKELGIEVIDG